MVYPCSSVCLLLADNHTVGVVGCVGVVSRFIAGGRSLEKNTFFWAQRADVLASPTKLRAGYSIRAEQNV